MSEDDIGNRRVVMDETIFMYLVGLASKDVVIKVEWPGGPITEVVTHWEPVLTRVELPYFI